MTKQKIKENLVYRKDVVLKDKTAEHLEEMEHLHSKTCFDENGNVLSEVQYDSSENIIQESILDYDANGRLIEEVVKDSDGFVVEHKRFEIQDSGRVTKEFRYYMDETFDTIVYHYEGDHVVKREIIDFDGEIENVEEFVYQDGLLIEKVVKDGDDEILTYQKITYDDQKNIIELEEVDHSEGVRTRTEYEYYASGNKKSVLVFDASDELVEKTLLTENEKGQTSRVVEENKSKKNTINMEYDNHGNVVFQEEFDIKGDLVSSVRREYNAENMITASEVYISGMGRGLSRNYTLRQEYIYF
jgi:antitoxin component YwqK of YwqJK toxin-antitoxin module